MDQQTENEKVNQAPAQRLDKHANESSILGVSVRAWIAMIIVVGFTVLCFRRPGLEEKMFALASMAVGFYLGQKSQSSSKQ